MCERHKLWRLFWLAVLLQVIGTIGFHQSAGLPYSQSAYSTLILLLERFDHYGYEDFPSRFLVVFLIICSYVLVGYLLKWFAEYIIGIGDNVRKRRMKAKIDAMKDHYIVCGLGRVGSQVARELKNEGITFVALDRDQARVDEGIANGYIAFQGDSSLEDTLTQAGIDRAAGLVACLGEDALNLYITLAAKALNPGIYVVARANRAENEVKLKRAGADRVAQPYQIGGYHMATMALRPNVVDYMDVVNTGSSNDLQVEEMIVGDKSKLAGHHLSMFLNAHETGATVIAINGADGTSRVRPTGKEVVYPGDRLIILGAKSDLNAASELIR